MPKKCESVIRLLHRNIITMDELGKVCNETHRNVALGFTHMGTQFGKVNTELQDINYVLRIICKHLNIPIEDLMAERKSN